MKVFYDLSLGKKLFTGFVAVLVILVLLSTSTYFNFSKLYEATEMNKHTYEVLMGLQNVMAEMINMEPVSVDLRSPVKRNRWSRLITAKAILTSITAM